METKPSPYRKHLYVCVNQREPGKSCCAAGGGEAILEKLKAAARERGLKGKVRVSRSGCMDLCAQGPNVMVAPDHRWYAHVALEDVDRIIAEELAPLTEIASGAEPAPREIEGRPRNDKTIRAFLFDVGNVLFRFDHMQAAAQITQGTGASAEGLFQLFFESPLVVDHDEGRISTEEFYARLRSEIGLDLSYERFLGVWNDIFTEDRQMTALAERLMKRYPCYLISNTNRAHFEFLRARFPILRQFRASILSYEVGHLKPHPTIYRRALELAGLPAEEILYVDDRADLVEAGRAIGFQVHRFEAADGFEGELRERGLLGAGSATGS